MGAGNEYANFSCRSTASIELILRYSPEAIRGSINRARRAKGLPLLRFDTTAADIRTETTAGARLAGDLMRLHVRVRVKTAPLKSIRVIRLYEKPTHFPAAGLKSSFQIVDHGY